MTNQGKLLTKLNLSYVMICKSLPCLVNSLKIIKYQNVFSSFLSQNCVQKYLVCLGPKLNLEREKVEFSKFLKLKETLDTLFFEVL